VQHPQGMSSDQIARGYLHISAPECEVQSGTGSRTESTRDTATEAEAEAETKTETGSEVGAPVQPRIGVYPDRERASVVFARAVPSSTLLRA
jgi:hypothetical protein